MPSKSIRSQAGLEEGAMIFLLKPEFGVKATEHLSIEDLLALLIMALKQGPSRLEVGVHHLFDIVADGAMHNLFALVEPDEAEPNREETGILVRKVQQFQPSQRNSGMLWIPGEKSAGMKIVDSQHDFLPLGIQTSQEAAGGFILKMGLYYAPHDDVPYYLRGN